MSERREASLERCGDSEWRVNGPEQQQLYVSHGEGWTWMDTSVRGDVRLKNKRKGGENSGGKQENKMGGSGAKVKFP